MQDSGRAMQILLVEDSEGDIRLTQEGLKEAKLRNELLVCRDGLEAIAFLQKQGQYQSARRPDF